MGNLMTTFEVASMLRVNVDTVREYIARGLLVAVRGRRKWLISESAVQEFLTKPPPRRKAS